MATATETPETDPATGAAPATYPPHRITIDRYERMVEAGVYRDGEPVFLWHGELVEKMTKNCPHATAVSALTVIFARRLPDAWSIRVEQPVALGDDSMPEPDLAVVRGEAHDYDNGHPRPDDIALIVEVSDSSLAIDSGDVLRTYAAQGVPVYWIVNLPKRRIEVYREPSGPAETLGYRASQHYGPGDDVPVVLDGVEVGRVAVADILPRL